MNKRQYLLREAERWKESGIISEEQAARIAALYAREERGSPLPLLAGILLGLGVLTFVASNWDGMSHWLKLAVIILALVACHAAGEFLRGRDSPRVGLALTITGLAVYGAGFFLIGQMYHLSANPVMVFYLWFAGAVTMAWHYRSPVLAALSQLLLIVSAVYGEGTGTRFSLETALFYLLSLGAVVPLVRRLSAGWLAALVTAPTLAVASYDLADAGGALAVQALFTVCLLAALLLARRDSLFARPLLWSGWAAVAVYATVLIFGDPVRFEGDETSQALWFAANLLAMAAFAAALPRSGEWYRLADLLPLLPVPALYVWHLFAGQPMAERVPLDVVELLALFAGALGLVLSGERRRDVARLNLGAALFGLSCVLGYVNFAWDFLDKSMFFLLGGVLLLALSWWLERQRRRWVGRARRDQA